MTQPKQPLHCQVCHTAGGMLLTDLDSGTYCLPCLREKLPARYAGLWLWVTDHPLAAEKGAANHAPH